MFQKSFGAITAAALAFLSLAGAIVGITVSATNLKNDFEASKSRVSELEGQVATLRDLLDKAPRGTAGPAGPAGPQGPEGPKGEPGPAGTTVQPDENELRRLVTTLVREELARSSGGTTAPAAAAPAGATPVARRDACFDSAAVAAGSIIETEEGAKFCAADGAVVMEVKDIGPNGQLAVGRPGDAGKWCKECDTPWNAALTFRAEKVQQQGIGYTALLAFRAK